jgi:hypothetical protein
MSREQDQDATELLSDPGSPLGGTEPQAEALDAPVSPFTMAAHRIAHEAQTDARAARQMEAERQHREAQEGEAG